MPSLTSTSKGRWRFVCRKLPSDGTHAPITEDLKRTGEARRRGAAELAHAERELQLTLDTIPTLVWQTRADGFAEYFNKRWLDYTGLSMEQALGWNWQVAIHPDDHRALLDSWRGILTTEKPAAEAGRQRRFEARLRRFDGAYRWFLFRPAPFRDERGRLIRWYGTNTDIEYQKRAESALQLSETLLAEGQKLSHTGSFGWNVSANEIFWSEETYRIFDYEPGTNITIDMALGRVHPDDRAQVEQAIERAKTQKKAFDLEHRLQLPNGAVENLHVVAHALVDEPQKLQLAGAVMDITARKQADQALRQSESRYQTLFQAMAVSFFEVDYTSRRQMLREVRDAGVTDFRRYFKENPGFIREIMQATHIVDVNDQTVALFGRGSKDEFLTSVEPFWPEESYQDYAEAVLASIERSRAFSVETRMRKLDGTIFDAHFTLRYASEDRTRGVVGVIDITARKQAEQTLRDSEARLAEAERELRLTLDSIPAITWRGGPNGYVQSLNKRWFDYTGTTPEQVRGARWKSCIHPNDLDHLVEAGTKYVASGKPIDAEARLRRFDGEYR